MNSISRKNSIQVIVVVVAAFIFGGCQDYLVFSTGTKFGLDISQEGDQPPKLLIGYKRAEVASIPAEKMDATADSDTYSVLGNVCIQAPGIDKPFDPIQIRSVFATGWAARDASQDKNLRNVFKEAAKNCK
ncbi:hypothetical protein [Candidatus Nitronereus thalassa]|uniref:Uncharacterized protein n=1 Tax=Candidatus Nitronereus thalassa TaxID=3020898 RepID=A0ABU3K798_9BACT|nr:hypothetical protein [Candidatus Nitronereus thalassa]MDT7042259.1 hypothetical protein [Candidatus Nitronereus thalassa]